MRLDNVTRPRSGYFGGWQYIYSSILVLAALSLPQQVNAVAIAHIESSVSATVTQPVGLPALADIAVDTTPADKMGNAVGNAGFDASASATAINVGGVLGGLDTEVNGTAWAALPWGFSWFDTKAEGGILIDQNNAGALPFVFSIDWSWFASASTGAVGEAAFA